MATITARDLAPAFHPALDSAARRLELLEIAVDVLRSGREGYKSGPAAWTAAAGMLAARAEGAAAHLDQITWQTTEQADAATSLRGLLRDLARSARELRGEQPDDLVTVVLRDGRADDATAAVCLDLDRGLAIAGTWAAIVRRDRVGELLGQTGTVLVRGPLPWDGSRFGDGSGGTVERDEHGEVAGDGLNASALTA